jgi:hypothetical protein
LAGGTPADMLFAALFAPRSTAAVAPLRRTHAGLRCSLHQGTLGGRREQKTGSRPEKYRADRAAISIRCIRAAGDESSDSALAKRSDQHEPSGWLRD